MADATAVRCPECGEPADRFCGSCGALVRARPGDVQAVGFASPATVADDEHAQTVDDLDTGDDLRRRGVFVMVAIVLVGLVAATVIATRERPEQVTAWAPRGDWTATGVTSNVAVEDLSTVLWEHGLDVGGYWGGTAPTAVTPVGGALVLTGDRVRALDADTLSVLWSIPAFGDGHGAVTADGITIVTRDELLTVDPRDGTIAARVALSESLPRRWGAMLPSLSGSVAIVADDGGVTAIGRVDGEVLWTRPHDEGYWANVDGVTEDLVLITSENSLEARELRSGELRWERTLPGERWDEDWLRVVGRTVVLSVGRHTDGATQGNLQGLDLATGEEEWFQRMPVHGEFAYERDGRLLIRPLEPHRDNELRWIDAATGTWGTTEPNPLGSPFTDGQLHFLAPDDVLVSTEHRLQRLVAGTEMWSAETGGWQSPAVHDGRVFAASRNGTSVLDLATGEELASYVVPQRWGGRLTLSGDTLATDLGGEQLLDLRTGEPRELDGASGGWFGPGSVVAPWGVLQRSGAEVAAYDTDGEERWRYQLDAEADQGLVAAFDDFVLFYRVVFDPPPESRSYVPPPPELVVVDAETGEEIDREEAALEPSALVSDEGSLWGREWHYHSRQSPDLVRYEISGDPPQLEPVWRLPAGPGHLLLDGDRLLDLSPTMLTIRDAADGTVERRTTLPHFAGGAPVLMAGSLVFDDGHRRVSAVDLDGRTRWSTELQSPIVGDPIAAGDRLYVATARGSVEVLDVASGEVVTGVQVASEPSSSASLLAARGVLVVRFNQALWMVGGPDGLGQEEQRPLDDGVIELP